MKNKLFLFLLLSIFFLNFIFASETTSIYYKVTIEAKPVCNTAITNTTINNVTYVNNVTTCYGSVEVLGIEDNHLTIIENFTGNNFKKTYSGIKFADIGNETDITGIMGRLDQFNILWNDLEKCKDSNRNISAQLFMVEEDIGFKQNFTECQESKELLQTKYDEKSQIVSSNTKEIEDMKNSLWMRLILGFIAGILATKYGFPYIQGRNTPKDDLSGQFHGNQPA